MDSRMVNKLGKYLKKNLDGAYKITFSPNMCDVFIVVYYQDVWSSPRAGEKYSDLYEMDLDINLTTYSNKLRINIIELSPEEQTVGHFVLPPEKVQDLVLARKLIMDKVIKLLNTRFEGYEFVF